MQQVPETIKKIDNFLQSYGQLIFKFHRNELEKFASFLSQYKDDHPIYVENSGNHMSKCIHASETTSDLVGVCNCLLIERYTVISNHVIDKYMKLFTRM